MLAVFCGALATSPVRTQRSAEMAVKKFGEKTMTPESGWLGSKVLITGGLGFIGSTLAIRLTQLGASVTVLDSLIPEYGGNPRNIAGFEEKPALVTESLRHWLRA